MPEKNKKLYNTDGQITTFCCGCGNDCPKIDKSNPDKVLIIGDEGQTIPFTAEQYEGFKQYIIDTVALSAADKF